MWQIDTIGAQGVLYDVAIVNDTLIYAVGEIFLRDSTGQIDPQAYCVAVWNGAFWTPKRVYTSGNQLIPTVRGIFAFTPTNVWLADGGIHQWDGLSSNASQSFGRIDLIGGSENGQSVDKLWGTGSSDLYGVGRAGMITHFDGTSWQKIESGTMVDLKDISGVIGGPILTVASSVGETSVLFLSSQTVIKSVPWPVGLRSVWISPSGLSYLSGAGGIWKQRDSSWYIIKELSDTIFYGAIRGNAENDIFVNAGTLAHFNGKTWQYYFEIPEDVRFYSISVRVNIVAAVGFTLKGGVFVDKAAIAVGRR